MSHNKIRQDKFVDSLIALKNKDDRGGLACLRRGLGRKLGSVIEMHPYIAGQTNGLHKNTANMYYLVASLYALHPLHTDDNKNGGDIYREINNINASQSTEKRFKILLKSNSEYSLAKHLQAMVRLAKSNKIAINYKKLLADICYWTHEEHFVQNDWAQAFWSQKNDNIERDE